MNTEPTQFLPVKPFTESKRKLLHLSGEDIFCLGMITGGAIAGAAALLTALLMCWS